MFIDVSGYYNEKNIRLNTHIKVKNSSNLDQKSIIYSDAKVHFE